MLKEIKDQLNNTDTDELKSDKIKYASFIHFTRNNLLKGEKKDLIKNYLNTYLKSNGKFYKMLLRGSLSIQYGDNPRILKELLLTYIDPLKRNALSEI